MPSISFIAKADVLVNATAEKVWNALVNPETIKQYMFGTNVVSDWKEGGKILWQGEWKGKRYEDKGTILKYVPLSLLQYSHFSPLTGLEDAPQNYHTVTVSLTPAGNHTAVSLSQDNNATESDKAHAENNWKTMLIGLKEYLEKTS